jgi:hypothetical protein
MDAGSRAVRRRLLAAAAVALGLRLAFGFGYWTDKVLTRDEREYLSLARGLAAGRGFVYDAEILDDPGEPFGRAPGYPAFLALVGGGRDVVAATPGTVKAAQAATGALGVLLIAALAARVGGPRVGVVAAWIAAVYPPLVWISGYVFSEALFWPLGLAAALQLSRALADDAVRSRRAAALAAILTAACILVRPGTLLFVPMGAAMLWWRRGLAPAVVFAGLTAALMTPWVARNHAVHDRFVLVASDGGVTFWTGNHPLATGEGDMAANPALKRANNELRAAHPGLTEEAMEPIYYREAFAWIAAHPIDWLVLLARKVFFLIVPIGPSYRLHSTLYFAASVISYVLLLAAAIAGARRLGARLRHAAGLWVLAAAAIAVSIVFFPQERFRIPIIDPALIVCAAGLRAAPRDATT